MIHHSVYGEIVAGWKWSGGLLNVGFFLFFAGVILWHLVRIRRQRRALQELRSSLPPIRTEWIELAQSSAEDDAITLAPLSAASSGEDVSAHTDDLAPSTQLQAARTAPKRVSLILLHISFALFMASLGFWPWAYVAFDLMGFYGGLLALWAIVVVAWTVAAGPSFFHALLRVYPDAQTVPDEPFLAAEEGGRTSPSTASRRGSAGIPSAVSTMPSRCKSLFQCLWTYSLQEKLTGMPSYEVIKGDKDLKIKRQWYQTRWVRLLTFYGGLLALLLASWFILYASASLCITNHPVSFSSRFTRSFSSPVCGVKNGTLCHVYVMPPYDGAHEMIVNLVLLGSLGHAPVQIHYDTTAKGTSRKDYQYVTSALTVVELPLPVGEGPRYAQAVLLSKLEPDTVYHFVVSVASGAEVSSPFSFRTLPAYGEVPIVVGGDSSVEPVFAQLLDVVGTRDVRLVMVAGDVAYANGMRSCYRRWDDWLAMWHTHMKTAEGHLMPLLTSIGNHDVGPGGLGTYWSGLFVQSKQALGAPRWQDRQTFHAHTISNHTLLMVLDTGHVTQAADQVTWMQNVFANNADLPNKLAAYHVPLYPSRRSYDDAINIDLRKHWLPVFDQNELDIGFEHHDHSYKRSKRLRAGQVHPNGTLYLGDGCFGVSRARPVALRPYLEKVDAVEHGFFVSIQERHVEIEAFDTTGRIFDRATVL